MSLSAKSLFNEERAWGSLKSRSFEDEKTHIPIKEDLDCRLSGPGYFNFLSSVSSMPDSQNYNCILWWL